MKLPARKAVGAPFVGLIAATLALSEFLSQSRGEPVISLIDVAFLVGGRRTVLSGERGHRVVQSQPHDDEVTSADAGSVALATLQHENVLKYQTEPPRDFV